MRIVGGRWKRTPLAVIDAAGLRPTPDRVRETLFNWLGQEVVGAVCLDLFAGTGALGFEAASRGAAEVWLVENDRVAAAAIEATLARLADASGVVRLVRGDAQSALHVAERDGKRFDLVFLDPPFGRGLLAQVAPALAPLLAPGAFVYVESDAELDSETATALFARPCPVVRKGRAGQVFYHLLRCPNQMEGQAWC